MKIGIIGLGQRMTHIARLILALDDEAEITAVCDPRAEHARDTMRQLCPGANIAYFTDADEMLDTMRLDGAAIGTRCSLHAQMAIKVMRRGLPMFLEKPVATSESDVKALCRAARTYGAEAVVSFPLRVSPLVKAVREIILSGKLGDIEHVQAFNNIPYGPGYSKSWYRDFEETGGLFLQKATHDLDVVNSLLPHKPVMIAAMQSQRIFKGYRPPSLTCGECVDNKAHCPESAYNLRTFCHENARDENLCCFSENLRDQDSGSALVLYESGMHAVYSQNFYSRKAAAARGARLIGHKGTVEFDFYKSAATVMMHMEPRVDTVCFEKDKDDGHGGGDECLVHSFLQVMRREASSAAPLEAGLMSALMCVKAAKSAHDLAFEPISLSE